ncbi:MAG: DUF72 domain-containing protein [Candidatus Aenigmarchaeota archaeon]|nr:DUF72 domain-containing protein [Candidatus Aenigmarchaeota archaeon]
MKVLVGSCGLPLGLEKYSKIFDVVEVQKTFYKLVKEETAKRWREKVPNNFEFTIKVFQGITHPTSSPTWKRSGFSEEELESLKKKVGYLKPTREVLKFWKDMIEISRLLRSKILIIQLPASFKDEKQNWANVKKIFERISRKKFVIGIELRRWEDKRRREFCRKFNLIDIVDPFSSKPQYFSKSKIAYFRLHGSPPGKKMYYYKYTLKDLKWLKGFVYSLNVRKVYVMFNNVFMKDDAKRFVKMVKEY